MRNAFLCSSPFDNGFRLTSKSTTGFVRRFTGVLQVAQQGASPTTGGNVIVLNNNDMMQQRTSIGGQQVIPSA